MIDAATALLAIGGGVVVVKAVSDDKPAPKPAAPVQSARALISSMKNAVAVKPGQAGVKAAAVGPRAGTFNNTPSVSGGLDPKEITDAIAKKAKAEFDRLSKEAKREACQRLKAQYPNSAEIQAIDCDDPALFKAMVTAAGVAIGTAVGGPVGGAIGAVVATYAAPKLEEWANEAWDETKDAAEDAWHALTPW